MFNGKWRKKCDAQEEDMTFDGGIHLETIQMPYNIWMNTIVVSKNICTIKNIPIFVGILLAVNTKES